jgi:hypothetical protein
MEGFSTVAHRVENLYGFLDLIGDSGSGVGKSCMSVFTDDLGSKGGAISYQIFMCRNAGSSSPSETRRGYKFTVVKKKREDDG